MHTAAGAWKIVASKESIGQNLDDATLALRLGIAANAIRSAQRFYLAVKDSTGPAGERDRLWSFLVAMGYVHEAVLTLLRPNFKKIAALATAGGVDEQAIIAAGQLLSGRSPLAATLGRMRNKLIFHWDDDVVREYAAKFSAGDVTWAEGVGNTNGEAVFAVAANALTNSVLVDEPNASDERNLARVKALIQEATPAMTLITELFQRAIMGHISSYGPRLLEQSGTGTPD